MQSFKVWHIIGFHTLEPISGNEERGGNRYYISSDGWNSRKLYRMYQQVALYDTCKSIMTRIFLNSNHLRFMQSRTAVRDLYREPGTAYPFGIAVSYHQVRRRSMMRTRCSHVWRVLRQCKFPLQWRQASSHRLRFRQAWYLASLNSARSRAAMAARPLQTIIAMIRMT